MEKKIDDEAVDRIRNLLANNGHPYVFIDVNALPTNSVSEEHVKDHFRAFKPSRVRT